MAFSIDYTKVFICDQTDIYELDLSVAGDITTMTYNSVTEDISAQTTDATGLYLRSNGTKLYVSSNSGDEVLEYDLSVANDLSTLSYSTNSLDVSSESTNPQDLFFKDDGTKVWVMNNVGAQVIYQYTLSTAWDTSTGS